MLHIRGDHNVADHLSRILVPSDLAQDIAKLSAFISVFDKSALYDAINLA
jgi:predicted GNAT superfamily acetyltransferase